MASPHVSRRAPTTRRLLEVLAGLALVAAWAAVVVRVDAAMTGTPPASVEQPPLQSMQEPAPARTAT